LCPPSLEPNFRERLKYAPGSTNMSMRSALSIAVTAAVLTAFAVGISGQGRGGGGFSQTSPIAFGDHVGGRSIFDAHELKGWGGNLDVGRLEGSVIVGPSMSGTTYLIWKGGEPANFELKAEMKLEGNGLNSGIQYRSVRTGQT